MAMRKLFVLALLLCGGLAHAQNIQRIAVNGTRQQFEPTVNLIAGSGLTIGCSTNGTAKRQDCTFSSTGGGAATGLTLNANVGTYNINIISQDASDLTFTDFVPVDTASSNWYENFASSANTSGTRPDLVYTAGWNISAGGGRVNTGTEMGALSTHYEQFFTGTHHQMEFHQAFVDTSDNETRFMSFLGSVQDTTNTLLDLRANTLNLGSGRSTNDPAQIAISPTFTKAYSPNLFNSLQLDATNGVQLYAGTTSTAAGQLTIDTTGVLNALNPHGYMGVTGPQFQWHGSQTIMNSPDQGSYYQVANSDGTINIGGTTAIRFQPSYMRFDLDVYAATDAAYHMGDARGAFKSFRGKDTVATQDSCDSSHEGTFQPIFGGSGVADTFQVCQKNAAGAFAWASLNGGGGTGVTWPLTNGTSPNTYTSDAVDGAGVVEHIFDTGNAVTSALLLSVRNAGVEKFHVDSAGDVAGSFGYLQSSGFIIAGITWDGTGIYGNYSIGYPDPGYHATGVFSNAFGTTLGSQLTAASTITPITGFHHVTGSTTIDTITPQVPVVGTAYNGNMELKLVADGGTITYSAAGNIGVAGTIPVNTSQIFQYDETAAKWFPAQSTGNSGISGLTAFHVPYATSATTIADTGLVISPGITTGNNFYTFHVDGGQDSFLVTDGTYEFGIYLDGIPLMGTVSNHAFGIFTANNSSQATFFVNGNADIGFSAVDRGYGLSVDTTFFAVTSMTSPLVYGTTSTTTPLLQSASGATLNVTSGQTSTGSAGMIFNVGATYYSAYSSGGAYHFQENGTDMMVINSSAGGGVGFTFADLHGGGLIGTVSATYGANGKNNVTFAGLSNVPSTLSVGPISVAEASTNNTLLPTGADLGLSLFNTNPATSGAAYNDSPTLEWKAYAYTSGAQHYQSVGLLMQTDFSTGTPAPCLYMMLDNGTGYSSAVNSYDCTDGTRHGLNITASGLMSASNTIQTRHYLGGGSAPTFTNPAVAVPAGATITVTGTDAAFILKIVMPATDGTTGVVGTLNFAVAYGSKPHGYQITGLTVNSNGNVTGQPWVFPDYEASGSNLQHLVLSTSGTGAFSRGTTYEYSFVAIQ